MIDFDKILNMISVTILVKNGQKHIRDVLEALRPFKEVILFDTGSEDETIQIAKTFDNVVVKTHPFIGFGPSHNMASTLCKYDWVLSIDADEVCSKELVDELLQIELDPTCVYTIWRKNFYNNKWIKGCGWYPDRVVRLYNRKVTQFTDAEVHEAVISKGCKKVHLQGALFHYPYETIADFLRKMQSYSTLWAKERKGKKKSSLMRSVLHGFFAFFKSYILKRGFFLGKEGFIISLYNGHTAYYKYLKLYELNQNICKHSSVSR